MTTTTTTTVDIELPEIQKKDDDSEEAVEDVEEESGDVEEFEDEIENDDEPESKGRKKSKNLFRYKRVGLFVVKEEYTPVSTGDDEEGGVGGEGMMADDQIEPFWSEACTHSVKGICWTLLVLGGLPAIALVLRALLL